MVNVGCCWICLLPALPMLLAFVATISATRLSLPHGVAARLTLPEGGPRPAAPRARSFMLVFVALLLPLPAAPSRVAGDSRTVSLGLEFGVGLQRPDDVNDLIEHWIGEQSFSSLVGDTDLWPSFPGSADVTLRPAPWIDFRPEFVAEWTPLYLYASDGQDMRSYIISYTPGLSVGLRSGDFRLALGVHYSFARLRWKDEESGFAETWTGSQTGYSASAGFDRRWGKHLGWYCAVHYRWIRIDQLRTPRDETLWNLDAARDFRLDLSGFSIRGGPRLVF